MSGIIKEKINKVKSLFVARKFGAYKGRPYIGSRCGLNHPENIYVGERFSLGDDSLLQSWPDHHGGISPYESKILIGNNVHFMSRCHVSAYNKITIGNNVLFGDNVFITDNYHGNGSYEQCSIPPRERELYSKGPVVIEDNVWIGRNVCIMPGVTIGKYSIIGSNAVVTKDVPPYRVAVGVPARVIKEIK